MTLKKIYSELSNMDLDHDTEIALINLIGEFGRDEYARGFKGCEKILK